MRRRLVGWLWDHSQLFRRPARRLRQQLSVAAYWLRHRLGSSQPPRVLCVVSDPASASAGQLAHPVVRIAADSAEILVSFVAQQTETSIAIESTRAASYVLTLAKEPTSLPATFLESLLLAVAAEDLCWATGGWAGPAQANAPAGGLKLAAAVDSASATLSRLPTAKPSAAPEVYGRTVPHITSALNLELMQPLAALPLPRSGAYLLRDDQVAGRMVTQPVYDLAERLGRLPTHEGPPTALLLLPFLAVGGAESLLFELLEGWVGRYRILVVTTEPHRAELGQTVDRCRALTPHVYTLGDWLPRAALAGALAHLLRRWRVSSLMSWNGTVAFYDLAGELRAGCPGLRLIDQHFNHRGGWIERMTPRRFAKLDASVAVNQPTARALREQHGGPPEKVRLIHHGVRLPRIRSAAEISQRKQHHRELFGVPQEALVVGTFVRMHAQKRPLDVLALAHRLRHRGVWFVLAGGGPLDAEIDRELARRPADNLLRLPMQEDVEPLYAMVDLCLSTSDFEGLPVFLLDALARSLPAVATAVGDVPLLLGDGGGLLVDEPGNLDALETALCSLLDPTERQRRGAIGRATVAERFGLQRYREAYEELLFPEGEQA